MAEDDSAMLHQRALLAVRTLADRELPGIFVYLVCAIVYAVAIRHQPESLRVALVAVGTFLILAMLRLAFHVRGVHLLVSRPLRWRATFGTFAVGSILLWDAFALFEVVHRDFDGMSCILVVMSAMLRIFSIHVQAPDRLILQVYGVGSRAPLLVGLLAMGGQLANLIVFLGVLQAAYCVVLGNRVNAEFWQAVAANEALRKQSLRLEAANAALKAEIAARERMEIDLRLAQKLEGIGRLAAGVAHEIKTPLQAVTGNVQYASDAVNDLLRLVDAYRAERQALARGATLEVTEPRIAAAEDSADLAFVVENLPQALTMALDAVGRASTIVRSIKEFAHPGEMSMVQTDLNRALAATLAITRHEYCSIADVETDFGDVPPVVCHGGELNQVFVNLIVNAAHAIESARQPTGGKGRITVRTRRSPEHAEVSVSDTGTGIALETRERIFDAFFTTKPVGKGTGQGLAIARSVVVNRHGGEIWFDSELGRGTTFFVRIPIAGHASASGRASHAGC